MPTYVYDASKKRYIPSAGSGLPIIQLGRNTSAIDPNALLTSLNKLLTSQAAVQSLQKAGAIGIVVSGATMSSTGQAIYPQSPKGTLSPGSARFSVDAQFNTSVFTTQNLTGPNGAAYYLELAEVIRHEGAGHPYDGFHLWHNYPGSADLVAKDPVYSKDFQIESDLGAPIGIMTNYLSYKTGQQAPLTVKETSVGAAAMVYSVDGFVANHQDYMTALNVTEAQVRTAIAQNGYYEYTAGGQVIRVISDADYLSVASEMERATLESYYARNGIDTSRQDVAPFSQQDMTDTIAAKHLSDLMFFGSVGDSIGSALGNILAHGNQVEGILYSSVLGTIGRDLATNIINGYKYGESTVKTSTTNAFNNFATQVAGHVDATIIGSASSILLSDLASSLGVKGFAADMATSVGSSILTNIVKGAELGPTLLSGLDLKALSDPSYWLNSPKEVAPGAIGAFFGAKLAAAIVAPQTQAGAILANLGSSIGAAAFAVTGSAATALGMGTAAALGLTASNNLAWLGNIVVPGIGAFVGFVIGALIGNLFGHKNKPAIPTAGAETVLALPLAQYKLGQVTSTNGGSTDIAMQMANAAASTLNGLIEQVTGDGNVRHYVSNGSSPTQNYGYTGSQLYVKLAGVQYNVSSADQAVDKGVMWALPQTQIIGGDIFTKRAIKNSAATDITSLLGDIQTAKDYGKYAQNRDVINSYITAAYGALSQTEQDFYSNNKALVDKVDMSGPASLNAGEQSVYNGSTNGVSNSVTISHIVNALQSQSFANPWIISLERVNELNLNTWASSDFYGGLQGFLQSFGLGIQGASAHYEDVAVGWSGSSLTLTDSAASGQNLFSILSQSTASGTVVSIDNFASVMSYATAAMGTVTSGNTFETAAGSGSAVTLNNSGHAGYNIFIGGNGGNTITAGTNDTWIQGGAGIDTLRGGSGRDVILAGSGVTTIYGGSADSYLAAGSASGDKVTGGNGNDTIVSGTGGGSILSGGAGDDTFVLSGGGSGSIDGGGGSNTISFERYTSGVYAALPDWSHSAGSSYSVTNVSNLIGSAAGGNTLQTSGAGGTLQGGAGNDTFYGVSGGTTTVTFANSAGGVYVDLSQGISFGGSSDGDVFNNIKNVVGSAFNDELKGVAGSTLDGGLSGDDWFDFSGGGNAFKGNVNGNNTVDYSTATAAVTIDLTNAMTATGGTGQVSGLSVDKIYNVSRIVGSRYGTTITGLPAWNTTTSGNTTTYTPTNYGIYFVATGGNATANLNGHDTIELDQGSGHVTVNTANGMWQTVDFGNSLTYDNLFVAVDATAYFKANAMGPPTSSASGTWKFGIRGNDDWVSYFNAYSTSPTLGAIAMDGASSLDLTGITNLYGAVSSVSGTQYGGQTTTISGNSSNYTSPATANASTSGGSLIITNGTASVINVDGGAATTVASVVVAGKAGSGGITINTSSADDQFAFERGDGHYTINGTGGQKTIAFGPTVGADDVIYNVVGNDLYIGVKDLTNPSLTADQVADFIRIVNGAVGSVVSNNFVANNAYFVLVAGSSVDLSKINIGYKLTLSSSTSFSGNYITVGVGNSLTETVSGNGNVINGGTSDVINLTGTAGVSNTVNMSSGTVNLQTARTSVTINGSNDTVNVTGSDSTVTVHGTGVTVNASNATIYKGNTSTVTVSGTNDNVVTLGVAPIILDLDNQGLQLTAVAASDVVTRASNGALTRLGWVGPTNGILVTDRNGDGQYGNVQDISFVQDVAGAETDLEGLAGWDSNSDGVINAQDDGWSKLKVWIDANMDGVSSNGEVKSLDDLGIKSISLKRSLIAVDSSTVADSFASATSVFNKADGSSGTAYDVNLGQQVLTDGEWQPRLTPNAAPLNQLGELGHLSGESSDSASINYQAVSQTDSSLARLWTHDDENADIGNSASTVAPIESSVPSPYANRGAHIATSRMQVLDLDMSSFGPSLVDAADSGIKQDIGLTGNPQQIGWVGSGDGLLVVDAAGDGNIDAPTEATFQNWVPYAKTSLQGLAAFDTDGSGAIDAGDAVFSHLDIWTDSNGNGVSDAGELKSLSDLGVQSISLTADMTSPDHKVLADNEILTSSTVTMVDGTTYSLYDVALGVKTTDGSPTTSDDTASPTPSDPSQAQALPAGADATAIAATTQTPSDSLSSPLDSDAGQGGVSRGSDGPTGSVMVADTTSTDSSTSGWWGGQGQSLSDAINVFNSEGSANTDGAQTPVAAANDAAMIQRHLLLRQAIAGFTVQGAAPAVFARHGSLDGQNTLAAATNSVTQNNNVTNAAA